ncbi:MAG: hypothetical protein MZW92_57590 [Comamonadaceae bacterium]|nr:hypothetical protein [Comamonadaceae bacterium]
MRSQEAMRRTLDEEFRRADRVRRRGRRASILERHPVRVVLCDQRMPGLTGVAVPEAGPRAAGPTSCASSCPGYTDSRGHHRRRQRGRASTSTCSSPGSRSTCCWHRAQRASRPSRLQQD